MRCVLRCARIYRRSESGTKEIRDSGWNDQYDAPCEPLNKNTTRDDDANALRIRGYQRSRDITSNLLSENTIQNYIITEFAVTVFP